MGNCQNYPEATCGGRSTCEWKCDPSCRCSTDGGIVAIIVVCVLGGIFCVCLFFCCVVQRNRFGIWPSLSAWWWGAGPGSTVDERRNPYVNQYGRHDARLENAYAQQAMLNHHSRPEYYLAHDKPRYIDALHSPRSASSRPRASSGRSNRSVGPRPSRGPTSPRGAMMRPYSFVNERNQRVYTFDGPDDALAGNYGHEHLREHLPPNMRAASRNRAMLEADYYNQQRRPQNYYHHDDDAEMEDRATHRRVVDYVENEIDRVIDSAQDENSVLILPRNHNNNNNNPLPQQQRHYTRTYSRTFSSMSGDRSPAAAGAAVDTTQPPPSWHTRAGLPPDMI